MQAKVPFQEQNFFKQRLTPEELAGLAGRAGGVDALVAPTRKAEVEGMDDDGKLRYLLEDPARLRRPIIDTGDALYLGFNKEVQQELGRRGGSSAGG